MAKSPLHVLAKRPAALQGLQAQRMQRDQRKKILKMCVQKLRDIDDPETVLCRAVLINNTFKTLKTAQKRLLKKTQLMRRAVEEEEEEQEFGHQEVEATSETLVTDSETARDALEDDVNVVRTASDPPCFDGASLEGLSHPCDISSYNAESIVHSLAMPPLLSPQLEDMTNCSFYDTFTPVPPCLAREQYQGEEEGGALTSALKLTVLKGELREHVVTDTNSNHHHHCSSEHLTVHGNDGFEFCQKPSDYSTCGIANDMGESLLIDNLLSEIVQA